MKGYAVLTGDIVSSSDMTADELTSVMNAIGWTALKMRSWSPSLEVGFAQRGGDGWQVAIQGSLFWLRAALYLQAGLRRHTSELKTRIAVAQSDDSLSPIATKDPNAGHGPAFTASGRHLDELSGKVLMGHAAGGTKAAALRLADVIVQGWTQAQARAIYEALHPFTGTRATIAKDLGISREAVNQALWSGNYLALRDAIVFIEDDELRGQET